MLYGRGVSRDNSHQDEIKGITTYEGINVVDMKGGFNYDHIINAAKPIKKANIKPTHVVYNTDAGAELALLKDKNNNYIDIPNILKGKQGIGKTRWTKSLMPKQKINAFLLEGIQLEVGKVDDIKKITAYWLAELGEMGGTMKKSDRDALKAFITKSTDEFRTPYDRKAEKYPRKTFFIATVNDAEFLRDDTGNR